MKKKKSPKSVLGQAKRLLAIVLVVLMTLTGIDYRGLGIDQVQASDISASDASASDSLVSDLSDDVSSELSENITSDSSSDMFENEEGQDKVTSSEESLNDSNLEKISNTENDVTLNIGNGNINIYHDGYTVGDGEKVSHTGGYIITGRTDMNELNFHNESGTDIEYDVLFKNFSIDKLGVWDSNIKWTSVVKVGSSADNAKIALNLTVEGDNRLRGTIGFTSIASEVAENYPPTINITMKENSNFELLYFDDKADEENNLAKKYAIQEGISVTLLNEDILECCGKGITYWSELYKNIILSTFHKFELAPLSDWENHCQKCRYCGITTGEQQPHNWQQADDGGEVLEVCNECGAARRIPDLEGEGTQENPYLIGNLREFQTFANIVNGAKDFMPNRAACAKLTADIGTQENPVGNDAAVGISESSAYTGEFDGAGHTIFVNLSVDTTAGDDPAALFKFTNGATIHDLTTAGKITTSNLFAGGIVGSNGTNALSMYRCGSSVAITSTVEGDGTHGGLLGKSSGPDVIEDCYFSGKIDGASTYSCGGIAGWLENASGAQVRNCYVNASYTMKADENDKSDNIARGRDSRKITNCYYVNALLGSTNGIKVTEDDLSSGKLTWLLNGSGERTVWKQTLEGEGKATCPQFYGKEIIFSEETKDYYNETIVGSVTLEQIDGTYYTGSTLEVKASVEIIEGGEKSKVVSFSIEGNTSADTKIERRGSLNAILVIGEDETAQEITVKATSVLDFSKQATAKVNIVKSSLKVTIDSTVLGYTGENQAPDILVKAGENVLVENTDYTVTYFDGNWAEIAKESVKDVGTYFARVDGKGGYEEQSVTKKFTIVPQKEITIANSKNIDIYPDGYKIGNGEKVPHVGKYIIVGDGSSKKCELNFNSAEENKEWAYDVTFRNVNLTNEMYYSVIKVQQNVTLNLSIEGENCVTGTLGNNWEPISTDATEQYPTINLTMKDNSKLTLIAKYQLMVKKGIAVNLVNQEGVLCSNSKEEQINWTSKTDAEGIWIRKSHKLNVKDLGDGNHRQSCQHCSKIIVAEEQHTWKKLSEGSQKNYEICSQCGVMKADSTPIGDGTKESPYLIGSLEEFKIFANIVNGAEGFQQNTAACAKLVANVGTSAEPVRNDAVIGISESNPYTGEFDGAGHQIFVDLSVTTTKETGTDPAALFKFTDGAIIHDLVTAGTVTTSNQFAGGIVGSNNNALHMYQCGSTVAIASTVSGDGTHGGLLGKSSGADIIENCYFSGKIEGTNTTSCGGIAGWIESKDAKIKNCYVNASYTVSGEGSDNIARRKDNNPISSNCYYLNTLNANSNGEKKTKEQFASGKVTWLLNENGEKTIWKQTLTGDNVDVFPKFVGENVVYNSVVSNYYNSDAIVNAVTLESMSTLVVPGASTVLNAFVDVTGGNENDKLFTFSVSGNTSKQTEVKENQLFVGADEKAQAITVRVTSAINTTKWAEIKVDTTFTMKLLSKNFNYTGEQQQPEVSVTYKETVLEKGKDYILSYFDENGTKIEQENIKKIGKYKVKADGIGNYEGCIAQEQFIIWEAGRQVLNIEDGNIIIYYDGYKVGSNRKVYYNGKYIITGNTKENYLDFNNGSYADVTYDIVFSDFSLQKAPEATKTNVNISCDSKGKTTLNLTVEGENIVKGTSSSYCIQTKNVQEGYYPQINITMGKESSLALIPYVSGNYKQAVDDKVSVTLMNRDILACSGKDTTNWSEKRKNIILRTSHEAMYADVGDDTHHSQLCRVCSQTIVENESHEWETVKDGEQAIYDICKLCNRIKVELEGSGTKEEPYLIRNVKDLKKFAKITTNQSDEAACAKLMANIGTQEDPVGNDAVIGISESKPYKGNFDGNGHTIFVDLSVDTQVGVDDPAALFKFTDGATIHDLMTTGKITTSNKYAGGIVGSNGINSLNMQRCGSSVVITSTVDGDGTHGGLIAKSGGADVIENCYFSGKIEGTSTTSCGGIAGWMGSGNAKIRNCYVSASYTVSSENSNNIARIKENEQNVISNCYYLNVLNTNSSGMQKTAEQFASGEVTWLLNGEGERDVWKQTLAGDNADTSPNFTGERVVYNSVTSSYYNSEAVVNAVTMAQIKEIVAYGNSVPLTASVDIAGEAKEEDKLIDFTVSGNTSSKTKVENGVLFVGEDETAQKITIKAASAIDSSKYAQIEVKISRTFTLELTSTIENAKGDTTVIPVEGGGRFLPNTTQTVKAGEKEGYDFVGWFAKDNSEQGYDAANLLSSQLEYTFELTSDTSLVAVYRPDGKMMLEVKGPKFSVNGGTEQTSGNYSERFDVGTQITVKATGENFAYWSNASSKIMSTNQEYTFTLVGNTVLTAVYKNAAQNTAFVEFVSAYGQVMQAASYKAEDVIEIPVGPSKLACDFVSWNMTAEEIKEAIKNGETYIRVTPIYKQKEVLYTVKVFYGSDDSLTKTYENKKAGSTMTVTAKDIQGRKFAYWALDKEGTTVAATDKSYFFTVIKDMELYAIYVSEDETVETKPVVNVTDHYSIVDNNVNKVVFVTNRDVPEGYTVLEAGALYGVDASFGQEGASDAFVIGAKGVKQMISSSVSNKGVYVLSIRVGSSVDKIVYSRGYVIVKTPDGTIETIYSDISARSHNV